MKIKALGCGGMSSTKYRNTQFYIKHNGSSLLIDAGFDTKFSLAENGLSVADISDIYITHAHADHIGGLEYIAFMTYFNPTLNKPFLMGHYTIMDKLWNSLRLGLECIDLPEISLHTYFLVLEFNNIAFTSCGIQFNLVKTPHVENQYHPMDSYGLFFETENKNKVYITGDSILSKNNTNIDFYKNANIIFQDCETTVGFETGVHAHYNTLNKFSKEIKAKMYLNHYGDNVDDVWKEKAVDDGFKGFVPLGADIEI